MLRLIARSTDIRTVIAGIAPRVGSGNSICEIQLEEETR